MNQIRKIMLCAALLGAFSQAQAADQFVALMALLAKNMIR